MVGLYLNPPEKAMILCVDEKSQIQALQRTQPGLPHEEGALWNMTHDYKQHVTTTLFAALNVLDRRVIGECMPRHRHQEFLRFLRRLHREYPKNLDLHLIVNNPGQRILQRQPRRFLVVLSIATGGQRVFGNEAVAFSVNNFYSGRGGLPRGRVQDGQSCCCHIHLRFS